MKTKEEFVNLLTRHYCRISSYVFALVGNKADAEDILQETTSLMWQKYETDFEPGTDFIAWAKMIARYKVMSFRKKQAKSNLYFCDEVISCLEKDMKEYCNNDILEKVDTLQNCVSKLDNEEKKLINLKYNKGFSTKVLAEIVGVSIHSIYRRFVRIHNMLKHCMEGIGK